MTFERKNWFRATWYFSSSCDFDSSRCSSSSSSENKLVADSRRDEDDALLFTLLFFLLSFIVTLSSSFSQTNRSRYVYYHNGGFVALPKTERERQTDTNKQTRVYVKKKKVFREPMLVFTERFFETLSPPRTSLWCAQLRNTTWKWIRICIYIKMFRVSNPNFWKGFFSPRFFFFLPKKTLFSFIRRSATRESVERCCARFVYIRRVQREKREKKCWQNSKRNRTGWKASRSIRNDRGF